MKITYLWKLLNQKYFDEALSIVPYLLQNQAKECLDKGDIEGYFCVLESYHRVDGFLAIAPVLSPKTYWQSLSFVWQEDEAKSNNNDFWIALFELKRLLHARYMLMNKEERDFLKSLPDTITIYRGGSIPDALSWTVDKAIGEFFVQRHITRFMVKDARLFTATVPKNKVYAYFNGRNEKEIVVNPKYIKVISKSPSLS